MLDIYLEVKQHLKSLKMNFGGRKMNDRSIWEKFERTFDSKSLIKEARDAGEGNNEYKEVPHGDYEIKFKKLVLTKSKKDAPMVQAWMEIIEGEYKGSLIFYNQVISSAYGLINAKNFISSLESGVEIEFESFPQFYDLLQEVFEAIDGSAEYVLKYGAGKNGFNTYEITEVFEV